MLPYIDACMYIVHTCAMLDFEILNSPRDLTDAARASTSCASSQLAIFTSPGKWHFFCVLEDPWNKRFWRTFQIVQTHPFKSKQNTEILHVWIFLGWPLTSLLWYRYDLYQGTLGSLSPSTPDAGWQQLYNYSLPLFAKDLGFFGGSSSKLCKSD